MKEFLSREGVAFTLRDVNVDAAARAAFLARGYRLPPVTVIDGEAVEGFQPERLEALLARVEGAGREP